MENQSLKNKFKIFFTYDLWKIICLAVAVCFALVVIYNIVEKKPTEGQRFSVLYGDDIIVGEEVNDFLNSITDLEAENSFSYDVLAVESKTVQSNDGTSLSVMATYADVNDDDIFISSNTLMESYVSSHRAEGYTFYLERTFNYLYDNGFYNELGEINEDKIVKSFLEKYAKDSRFKKSEELEKGKNLEIKRIKTIYENASVLKSVMQTNPEIFIDVEVEGETYYKYALDLGKLKGGKKNLENMFKRKVINQNSGEITYTIEGVYLLIGNNSSVNGDLHYESLTYIVQLLKTYSNLI